MERLNVLFKSLVGDFPEIVTSLTGSASNRKYYRLSSAGASVIGVIGTDARENNAFVKLSSHMRSKGINVPEVLAVSDDGYAYVQEDLGDVVLFDVLQHAKKTGQGMEKVEDYLCETMSMLPKIQFDAASDLDFSICYPQPSFDRRMIMFDLNYFKYCFLKPSGLEFDEVLLQDDFERFADDLLQDESDTFMYRDFNARNVMLRDGVPYFVDFQGGRRGPIYYDVASFVWQARASYPDHLKERMLDSYLSALKEYSDVDADSFNERLRLFVLFRSLQVLGAYGFRGLIEQKSNFITSIPAALKNLSSIVEDSFEAYPYMTGILRRMTLLPRFSNERNDDGRLEVKVYSFAYGKGIPQDISGNGGGYVFDCRSIHNPGRYEPYKKMTGRDEPVKKFLEDDGEVFGFLDHAYGVVDSHVETFCQRGFMNLMVSFGCTGGQHRSVYCAEHMAQHLSQKYPSIRVRLIHREQGIDECLLPPVAKAMIFAAGLGTRLKPLTDSLPKALVPVCGKPLIEHVMDRLSRSGIKEAVVNVHHFADKVEEWVEGQDLLDVKVSDERAMLLETGGAVLHARHLLEGCGRFLIHNVDILSDADLGWFASRMHPDSVASLLVSNRETSRYFLFAPDSMRLVGWKNLKTGECVMSDERYCADDCLAYAFSGIHIMSDRIFDLMDEYVKETGIPVGGDAGIRFPVRDFYLWVARSHYVQGVLAERLEMLDVGKLDALAPAEEFIMSRR